MRTSSRLILVAPLLVCAVLSVACGSAGVRRGKSSAAPRAADAAAALDGAADAYVHLVLAVGRHDAGFVDAYYGPAAWQAEVDKGAPVPIAELRARTRSLLEEVRRQPRSARRLFLEKQLVAVGGFLRRLAGERMSLAEESRLLFDITPPVCHRDALEAARARLEALLPGEGTLAERLEAARASVEVPPAKLPAVVDTVRAEARRRTRALVELPADEVFRVSFVTGKPWGAYNWYKGDYQSLIEVNTDLPKTLDSVYTTLAHEGYPGHHVFNVLLEQRLVRGRGWREYTVYPLYSPQSLIAEGTANVGPRVIMSEQERGEFLRGVLAPIAGIAPAEVEHWEPIRQAAEALRCADGEAARMLLDEGRSQGDVEAFLERYGESPERAAKSVSFIRTYRSYVFNYTAGEDLVDEWIGHGPDRTARFFELLQRPAVPSELVVDLAARKAAHSPAGPIR